MIESVLEPRPTCAACRRPAGYCYCEHVTPTRTRTRVVVLQHPREAKVPLGTLRMVQLSLPDAIVRRGIELGDDPVVRELCAEDPPPYVLYPGPEARDIAELEGEGPITLIAVDGTWAQARALLRRNPALAALPRVAFQPGAPSAYRIRRQPAEHCVSTIEALARALDVLEGTPGRFDDVLLRPLHALVADQLRCSQEHKAYRTARRKRRDPKPPPPDSAHFLREHWPDLVCVQGDANGWPLGMPDRPDPEIVVWRARRMASGETFSAVVRPRGELGPMTPENTGLTAETLLGGTPWSAFAHDWDSFRRPDDVLAVWGHFHAGLAAHQGLDLPATRLDVRVAASRALRRRPGDLERCAAAFDLAVQPTDPGRCARRMTLLEAVVTHLVQGDGSKAQAREDPGR